MYIQNTVKRLLKLLGIGHKIMLFLPFFNKNNNQISNGNYKSVHFDRLSDRNKNEKGLELLIFGFSNNSFRDKLSFLNFLWLLRIRSPKFKDQIQPLQSNKI